MSIKSLRESGIEPGAIVSKLVSLGTGDGIDLKRNVDEFKLKFSLSKFSTAPVRFEKEALETISRKLLSSLEVDQVSEFLDAIGVPNEIKEDFWEMAKDNVNTKGELESIWHLCKNGVNSPVIAPQDEQFIEVAFSLISEYPRENDSWQKLTEELKTCIITSKE